MRYIRRYLQPLRVVPCRAVRGSLGGLFLSEDPAQAYEVMAAVRPDRKSERRQMGTLRPRERRLIFIRQRLPIRQGDHLYFAGDTRCWHCIQRRDFPAHQEIEAEVEDA